MSLFRVRRLLVSTFAVLALLPLAAACLHAQTGTITGRVTDASNGQPINGATVEARAAGGSARTAITGADGNYRIVNVPAGSYIVTFRSIGYSVFTSSRVDVSNGATITVNASMSQNATVLNETVITASRNRPEKALDAPAQISVISTERIEERPSVTVADHLRATPGVDISRGGIAQSNIVARGFNNVFSGSLLMLQDYRFAGVPSLRVNVPLLMTGTNEDIDRIEVLLGPASALYGPNSSSGVLHVITKSPFNSQGTMLSLDGGEREVLRAGIRHAGLLNDRVGFKISGEFMRGRDFEYNDLTEPRVFPSTSNVPVERRGKPSERDFLLEKFSGEARLDFRPNEASEAITTVGISRIGSGIELTGANGSALAKNWTYTNFQQRFRYNRFFAQAFLNMNDAGNADRNSASGTYLLRSGQPIVDQSRVWALQAQHGLDWGTKQSFTYGIDYINTNPRTGGTINGFNEDNDDVQEYGAYIQSSTRPTDRFELLAAARVDGNNVIEGNFFSPRAALIFKPTETQNLRLTYNRSFSTPANFAFFLDLISFPNIRGSGFDVVARGNPPKTGWQFRRDCEGSAFGEFCMRSRFVQDGAYVPVSAASAFPGVVAAFGPAITPQLTGGLTQALVAAGFPQANAAALAANLGPGLVQYLQGRSPTSAELPGRVSYLTSGLVPLTPAQLTDVSPLEPSYNQTYELGYKGIIGNRFRYDMALWRQERGEVASNNVLTTPNVFFEGTQLGAYIGANIGAYLVPQLMQQAGLSQAQASLIAQGFANAATPSIATQLAQLPVGVVTFAGENTSPTAVYATYSAIKKKLWVTGLDLATDFVVTDNLTLDVTYSYQNRNVWDDILVGGAPFSSNSPKNRGTLGARYRNENNGFGAEARMRYAESYPVNSSGYATNVALAIAPGQPGHLDEIPTDALGYNKCNPPAAGTFCYEGVPDQVTLDLQVSKRFDLGAQRFTWSISAQNILDNRVRTFPGVPEIGRLVLTRLQYSF